MKIQVEKLRNTLALLHPVIPKRPTLPVLSNVLVMDGKVTASDLETSVAISLPEAHGPFLMNYRAVTQLLQFVPGYEMLTIEPNGKSIKLSWVAAAPLTRLPSLRITRVSPGETSRLKVPLAAICWWKRWLLCSPTAPPKRTAQHFAELPFTWVARW